MTIDKARTEKEGKTIKEEASFWFKNGCDFGHSESCKELKRYKEFKRY